MCRGGGVVFRLLAQGSQRPRVTASKGQSVQGTQRSRGTLFKGHSVHGKQRPRDTAFKEHSVQGTCCRRQYIRRRGTPPYRYHIDWRWPLPCVLSVMMVFSAQLASFYSIYPFHSSYPAPSTPSPAKLTRGSYLYSRWPLPAPLLSASDIDAIGWRLAAL